MHQFSGVGPQHPTPNTQLPNTQLPNTQLPNTQPPNTQLPTAQQGEPEEAIRLPLPAGEVARAGLVVLGLALAVDVLWQIQEVIFLMFLSILLATAIEPLVRVLRRGRFGRGGGVLLVYTGMVLVLGTLTAVTVPSLAAQSDAFVAS